MQSGWRIGSVFGIPLFLDPSWFFILALFTIANSLAWQNQYPGWGIALTWTMGLFISLLLFASVLLHELGHSLTARSQGIKVNSITLFLFGGIASIDKESKTPGEALQVAIAGPLVSLIVFFLLSLLSNYITLPEPISILIDNLAYLNFVLAMFNLIPGLPLDGGQVLKAIVWKITGNRFKGVHWAAKSGLILGWAAIILGVTAALFGGVDGGFWIALLGWFGVRNASNYDSITYLQEALLKIVAAEAMTREFRVIDANLTVREFADNYLLETNHFPVYFTASDGRYRGMVSIEDLRLVERSLWESTTLESIVHPLPEMITVQENTVLVEVINTLENHQLFRITVLSPAGTVAGIIDKGDIVRTLLEKLNMPMSEEMIKRIKEDGNYPPGLQLSAIAKSTIE